MAGSPIGWTDGGTLSAALHVLPLPPLTWSLPWGGDARAGKCAECGDGKSPCLPLTHSQMEVGTQLYPHFSFGDPMFPDSSLCPCLFWVKTLLFIKEESSHPPCPTPFWLSEQCTITKVALVIPCFLSLFAGCGVRATSPQTCLRAQGLV